MNSAHWLKKRRETLGITQDQFAERLVAGGLKITKAAISKWELKKAPLPLQIPQNRRIIAAALDLSIPELLVLDGYEIEVDWSYSARYVATLFDSLSSHDRDTVLLVIDRLKSRQDQSNKISATEVLRALG